MKNSQLITYFYILDKLPHSASIVNELYAIQKRTVFKLRQASAAPIHASLFICWAQ